MSFVAWQQLYLSMSVRLSVHFGVSVYKSSHLRLPLPAFLDTQAYPSLESVAHERGVLCAPKRQRKARVHNEHGQHEHLARYEEAESRS